ncbi:hypothetical protein AVEN_119683-1 [Araneus ventricosus]|uniref:Uncharacterized protein n=1 Tax=Araneus ventricosus TaxID=182803 RepID=A0A4Y2KII8_ARAVE|nr:hypothetical protein AVEN_119683-1 [Araneus ventricosus]
MESMRLSMRDWGIYSLPLLYKIAFQLRIVSGGDKGPATLLLRISQTCSIGFMSEEYAGQSIRRIPSTKTKLSISESRCELALSSMRMDSSPIAAA